MNSKVAAVLVLGIGIGSVAGVSWFRASRLTAADIAEAAKAQERLAAVEKPAGDAPAANATDTSQQLAVDANKTAAPAPEKPAGASFTVIPLETMPATAPDTFTVWFETTKGDFAVEFTRAWAPNGVDRMYDLVKKKFFTDMRTFRVVSGFVVQFGISGDPKVSLQWKESEIPDDPVKQSNTEGMFTFAAGGRPNTRSTQVFINLGNNAQLDGMGFAPIGKVVVGMDVVKSLFSGYGESITELQEQIMMSGNAFLDGRFPNLDSIKKTEFIEPVAAAAGGPGATAAAAPAQEQAPDTYKVKFQGTMGAFTIECTRAWSPNGADRFYTLVKNGFYNDAKFFRVVPGFIVQFGLPGDPAKFGGWVKKTIPDDPFSVSNEEGTVVFAKPRMKNARSTQLFINTGNNASSLDPQGFTPFGKVIEGLDVVKKINATYGETPEQSKIRELGNTYLDDDFPLLDGIATATIVEGAP